MCKLPCFVETPAADAIFSCLIGSLGSTAKHQAVDAFFDLPQEVKADAHPQGSDENAAEVAHDGVPYVVGKSVECIRWRHLGCGRK